MDRDELTLLPAAEAARAIAAGELLSADLVAACPPGYDEDPNVPPLIAWPEPNGGNRVRTYSMDIPQEPGRLALLRFALRALFGRLAQARDFDVVLVENMEIETRHKHLRVATDGEVSMMRTPLSYRVLPRALTVIAPD